MSKVMDRLDEMRYRVEGTKCPSIRDLVILIFAEQVERLADATEKATCGRCRDELCSKCLEPSRPPKPEEPPHGD